MSAWIEEEGGGHLWMQCKASDLGPVHTMDREVGPWKMAFFHGPTSWSNFHDPVSLKINLQSFWAHH